MLQKVIRHFELPEFEDIVIQKWMHGKKCVVDYAGHYNHCRQIIHKNEEWTAENETEFCEKTVDRVEN